MVNVEIIKNEDGFKALKEEWHELLQNSLTNYIFLTWEWQYLWWKHLGVDRKLHIITVRMDGLLIAIAPLVLRPRRFGRLIPFRVLEFIGSGSVGSDYLNILIRKNFEDIVMEAVAGSISERKLALELSQVERTAYSVINLAKQLASLHWGIERTTTEFCPYISLKGHSWESFVGNLGSSHRQNLRRKIRKLQKRFTVRFEQVHTEAERVRALDILVELHLKRWRTRGGSDAFNKPALIAFHKAFTRQALRNDQLRLYVLWLDDQPAAALYGFQYNSVFYFYQAGFDPDFYRYSVGLVTMGFAIRDAMEAGLCEFDFLHGNENYKYLWTSSDRELVRINLYPPRLLGVACQLLMHVRKKLKKAARQVIPERTEA